MNEGSPPRMGLTNGAGTRWNVAFAELDVRRSFWCGVTRFAFVRDVISSVLKRWRVTRWESGWVNGDDEQTSVAHSPAP